MPTKISKPALAAALRTRRNSRYRRIITAGSSATTFGDDNRVLTIQYHFGTERGLDYTDAGNEGLLVPDALTSGIIQQFYCQSTDRLVITSNATQAGKTFHIEVESLNEGDPFIIAPGTTTIMNAIDAKFTGIWDLFGSLGEGGTIDVKVKEV